MNLPVGRAGQRGYSGGSCVTERCRQLLAIVEPVGEGLDVFTVPGGQRHPIAQALFLRLHGDASVKQLAQVLGNKHIHTVACGDRN